MTPCGKKTTSGIMLGMCYILSTTKAIAPPIGVWGSAPENFFGLIFRWVDSPMVLCMGLHMVSGYDGFQPLYFVDIVKGTMIFL